MVQGFGTYNKAEGGEVVPGFDGNTGGFLVGFDRTTTKGQSVVGVAAGYSQTKVREKSAERSEATVSTPRIILYGSAFAGKYAVDGSLGYGYNSIDSKRPVTGETVTGSYHTHEFSAAVQVGRTFTIKKSFLLNPRLGIEYATVRRGEFSETGEARMDVEKKDDSSFRPYVGLSAGRPYRLQNGVDFLPDGRLKHSRELMKTERTEDVTYMDIPNEVTGLKTGQNIFSFGTGFAMRFMNSLNLFADYDADLASGSGESTTQHTLCGGLRYQF
jgi:outer membrane autotransporter protein